MSYEAAKPDPSAACGGVLDEWMTQAELAQELGVSADTLQRWASQRIGPPRTKVGGRVYYRKESVKAWLRAQEAQQLPGARS